MGALAQSSLRVLEALATPHRVDRYLELVHPMLSVRELRAEVVDFRRPTAGATTLTLRPTRHWRGFRAGQFVAVSVRIDGVLHTRCYSPSCSQHRADGRIEITVKKTAGGVVSPWLHANARRGLVVGLTQADGTFTLAEQRPERLVLISGGSGITPLWSMLRTLRDEGHRGRVVVLHYEDDPAAVIDRAELVALDGVDVALVEPDRDGYFSPGQLAAAAPWWADAETYVCGPAGLMHAVREHFRSCGLLDRLHAEEFAPPLAAVPDDATGTVHFASSGTSTTNSGATLLEQAEGAGLTPPYGCRMGICFTCTQVKRTGRTRNLRTGACDDDPGTEIQLCINVAVGDVELNL